MLTHTRYRRASDDDGLQSCKNNHRSSSPDQAKRGHELAKQQHPLLLIVLVHSVVKNTENAVSFAPQNRPPLLLSSLPRCYVPTYHGWSTVETLLLPYYYIQWKPHGHGIRVGGLRDRIPEAGCFPLCVQRWRTRIERQYSDGYGRVRARFHRQLGVGPIVKATNTFVNREVDLSCRARAKTVKRR